MSRDELVTLTTRLNLFFAATLAVVLAGFSASLYLLARQHLHRQADECLDAALNTLAAAAEVSPEGLEWEPAQRRLTLSPGPGGGELAWVVTDALDRLVDHGGPEGAVDLEGNSNQWQVRRQWVTAPASSAVTPGAKERKYSSLSITVGVPLAPVRAELRNLATTLTGLSLAIWIAAVVAGRAVCRRALRPVQNMAAAASRMEAADLSERLPSAPVRDEVGDLVESFNGLLNRVQDSFERQQRFTGDASHQLRTPLTAILGQAEVALRRERSTDEYRDVLGKIHGRAQHLMGVVEALLFLARADSDAAVGELEVINFPRWLTDHLGHWADHPRRTDVRLEVSDDDVPVKAQPALLGQLADNLLDNAFKHSLPSSPVTLAIKRDGSDVLLSVEDRGDGIAAEDLPHVFEPFYRSADTRRKGRPGIGLGLAVARRIAVAFGGTLTAESEPGQWTRLTLRLR